MTLSEATAYLTVQLSQLYEQQEAAYIAGWVMESLTGWKTVERKTRYNDKLSGEQAARLEQYLVELLRHRPVQYVLSESHFYRMKFYVDEHVLIPRPETEELVEWCLDHLKQTGLEKPAVLDMGTGSGCIAVAIKKMLPTARVYALDCEEGALAVAQKNATALQADITFLKADILQMAVENTLPLFDCIISNPPYITPGEKDDILPNVLQYEPHTALFVHNDDALQFYKAIGQYAWNHLAPGGSLFFELHSSFAEDTKAYFTASGWLCKLKKDLQGRWRMLYCTKQ